MTDYCETCITGLRLLALHTKRKESSNAKRTFKAYRKRMGRYCFMCEHNHTPKQAMRGIELTHKAIKLLQDMGEPVVDTLAIVDSWRIVDLYRECPSARDPSGREYWDIPDKDETEGY